MLQLVCLDFGSFDSILGDFITFNNRASQRRILYGIVTLSFGACGLGANSKRCLGSSKSTRTVLLRGKAHQPRADHENASEFQSLQQLRGMKLAAKPLTKLCDDQRCGSVRQRAWKLRLDRPLP